MKKKSYSYKSVYRKADKEIEKTFRKVVKTPSDRGAFTFAPRPRVRGKVKLF
jgi:hypothetical protein